MEKIFDKACIDTLMAQAAGNSRRRQFFDLRNSAADTSQRILNALLPDTQVPIHRHESTSETVICLSGRLEEVFYECESTEEGTTSYREIGRVLLCPKESKYGVQIPAGVWHNIVVYEPSVIFEAKDGAYMG